MTLLDLQARMGRHFEHARATQALDATLGTLHGISWADFVLLDLLDTHDRQMAAGALARELGVGRARLVMQVLPLEKLGWVIRSKAAHAAGDRRIELAASGRRLVESARETAASICTENRSSFDRAEIVEA
jgi:DNA-binding MarR family transcriptional regulator